MTSAPALEAVVFDLDGVLVDSESRWDAARRAVVAQAGGRWRAGATEAMLGMNAAEWSRYVRDQLDVSLDPDEISARVVARLLDGYRSALPLLPGAVDAVRRLSRRWPLGLASASNRPVIDAVLELAGIAQCFAVTVSGDEVSRGKPAPDTYLVAARDLGVDPAQAAAVEDSSNGLRAAAAAGMVVVAVPNREFPPTADALSLAALAVESLEQLTAEAIGTAAARAAQRS